MNYQLPSCKYPAIKQLLVSRLQAVLDLDFSGCSLQTQLKSHPVHQVREQQRIVYVCAIALQLRLAIQLPALEIASTLAFSLSQEQQFTVRVMPPGLIHLELTQPLLAAWLQHLIQEPPLLRKQEEPRENYQLAKIPSSLFPIQYAHARCCSLLQLAQREGLIALEPAADNTSVWLVIAPDPIPWLNHSRSLCLCHPAEWAILAQLLTVLDDLYCSHASHKPINWYKAALNLSQAFQTFYSQCQIWGEIKSQNLQLAQARLGLVAIAQSVLRLLLQERLGLVALQEL